jgi:hypothetical protein
MPNDSSKSRRRLVAPGVHEQEGVLYANYREPGTGRQRFTRLKAQNVREARKERESILSALREGRLAARSDITLDALCDEWQSTREGRVAPRTLHAAWSFTTCASGSASVGFPRRTSLGMRSAARRRPRSRTTRRGSRRNGVGTTAPHTRLAPSKPNEPGRTHESGRTRPAWPRAAP